MRTVFLVMVVLTVMVGAKGGQDLEVKIIDRQNNQTKYSYVVPGQSTTLTNASVNCSGEQNSTNCSGVSTSSSTATPPRKVSYEVIGATLSLRLPDGRIAVVNCDSKLNWTDFSKLDQVYRSCKIPLVDDIHADFSGDKAKLKWSVSVDGKKYVSETYKILAVLNK